MTILHINETYCVDSCSIFDKERPEGLSDQFCYDRRQKYIHTHHGWPLINWMYQLIKQESHFTPNLERIVTKSDEWLSMKILFGMDFFRSRIFKIMIAIELKMQIRPRNINWQDWKYTLFVIFICHSQNIQRHCAMGRD